MNEPPYGSQTRSSRGTVLALRAAALLPLAVVALAGCAAPESKKPLSASDRVTSIRSTDEATLFNVVFGPFERLS